MSITRERKSPTVTTKDGLVKKKKKKSSTDLEKEAQLWKRLRSVFYLRKKQLILLALTAGRRVIFEIMICSFWKVKENHKLGVITDVVF